MIADPDPGPDISGCASDVATDYDGNFSESDLVLANVAIDNGKIKLQTGDLAINPDHIVIPFDQEVCVSFLYEGGVFRSDFGWVRYEDAVDASGNFLGFDNIPQDKLHVIFNNLDDNKNATEVWMPGDGIFDDTYSHGSFPYTNESAVANYDDGTELPFVVDGDGVVTTKDMKKCLGEIAGGTEIVFWLVSGRILSPGWADQDWDTFPKESRIAGRLRDLQMPDAIVIKKTLSARHGARRSFRAHVTVRGLTWMRGIYRSLGRYARSGTRLE